MVTTEETRRGFPFGERQVHVALGRNFVGLKGAQLNVWIVTRMYVLNRIMLITLSF